MKISFVSNQDLSTLSDRELLNALNKCLKFHLMGKSTITDDMFQSIYPIAFELWKRDVEVRVIGEKR